MHHPAHRSLMALGMAALLAPIGLGLSGCGAMPAHSNTLVFGTTTKLAVDVSQDTTGAPGVTIGYKRQEAVWMPLLANESAEGGDPRPGTCQSDACRKLVGKANEDTYSVLATFSGDTGGSAQAGEAKGKVVQYFATGFAARELARQGGAAAVSTAATSPLDPAINELRQMRIQAIVAKVSAPDGSLDAKAWSELLATDGVKAGLPAERIAQLAAASNLSEVNAALGRLHQGYLKPLHTAATQS